MNEELLERAAETVISYSYTNMRKIEFSALALTLRYLFLIEDERKV